MIYGQELMANSSDRTLISAFFDGGNGGNYIEGGILSRPFYEGVLSTKVTKPIKQKQNLGSKGCWPLINFDLFFSQQGETFFIRFQKCPIGMVNLL